MIARAIRERNLDGVVVVACTPSLHYETFSRVVETAGLSKYRFEMVSIRELDSWVHMDKALAKEKAVRLIAGAVAKLRG